MSEILNSAIKSVGNSQGAFCRFITANDTHASGSHQAGFLMPIAAYQLIFNKHRIRGVNEDKWVTVRWQDDRTTNNRMIYYGKAKNELRITRFGEKFPFFEEDHVGDLLIIAKHTDEDYSGYVLSTEEDIETFLAYFNLSPDKTNQLIEVNEMEKPNAKIAHLLNEFASRFTDFPETKIMSEGARECFNKAYRIVIDDIIRKPDDIIMNWYETEERLFKCMEEQIYSSMISQPFGSVEHFAEIANKVLNRRKSRAGKSLEHHLANIFRTNDIVFEEQAVTENNNKPDFLFPNSECYHNIIFPTENLTMLGVKTSCKDRWRQVLNEAERIKNKHLFTLQPGISKNQLKEMKDANLTLVVPHKNICTFPEDYQDFLFDLSSFIGLVRKKQETLPKYYLLN